MSFAFFDLDQTLLPYDTQALFCNYVLRRERLRTAYLAVFGPVVPLAALRVVKTRELKRLFLSYLWRMPAEKLRERVAGFVNEEVLPRVYLEVRAEVERHRTEGRVVILNTASPDFYAKAIGEALGFHHTFGTRVDFEGKARVPFLPKVIGPNNKRGAKLEAMRSLLPAGCLEAGKAIEDSWAYSDSIADQPMMELAVHPVMIHPDRRLTALGKERGWPALYPARPFRGPWGFRWACARQAVGLF